MLKYWLVFVFGAILSAETATADTIRIGAWNIQDLYHEVGVNLRKFRFGRSVARTQTDYDLLLHYRDQFGSDAGPADIIALQEIGTKDALEALFPSELYDTLMSSRWENDKPPAGQGDVYTAIAVRKASGIVIIARDDLPELAILHSNGRPSPAGTGALLEVDGQQFWFLSVHLKPRCDATLNAHRSWSGHCATLWRQIPILTKWIKEKRASGTPFIIAGDFNRRFRQFQDEGPIWKALNGIVPSRDIVTPLLVKHPVSATRNCPTRKGSSEQPIDWILMDISWADRYVDNSFWERRFDSEDVKLAQKGLGLSDHCPISIDLIVHQNLSDLPDGHPATSK